MYESFLSNIFAARFGPVGIVAGVYYLVAKFSLLLDLETTNATPIWPAIGIALILVSSLVLPRLIERMTPNIDEEKEIARGNLAVAQYFGRIAAASIIGMSIVIGAAVLAGVIAALHG